MYVHSVAAEHAGQAVGRRSGRDDMATFLDGARLQTIVLSTLDIGQKSARAPRPRGKHWKH